MSQQHEDEDTIVTIDSRSLRGFPLLDIQEKRVSDRAYFLWESRLGGDRLLHWLDAEAEELAHQAAQTLLFPIGCDRFLRDYSLINHARYAAREPQTQKHIGTRSPRICTLCESPKATFRSDAHVLPALTGSRWLLTYDECDNCNSRHGRHLDNELGMMLLPARAFGRLPTRSAPSAKLKLRTAGGSIGGQGNNEPLAMRIHAEDDSITLKHLDPNTMEVTVRGMPHYPVRALRSLARTMWHLLLADLRVKHSGLRAWIRGEFCFFPVTYYSGFVPGAGLRHTTFALWQSNDGMDLVYLFAFANNFLIMNTPNWNSGKQREFPLPPLPCLDDGIPSVKRWTLNDDSRKDNPTTYTISSASSRIKWNGGPQKVACTIISPMRRTDFSTVCMVEETLDGCLAYQLEGGDIMGRLVVTLGPSLAETGADQQPSVRFDYDLDIGAAGGNIPKTIDLVLALSEGGRLVAKFEHPDWFVLDATSPSFSERPDLEVLRQWLQERQDAG